MQENKLPFDTGWTSPQELVAALLSDRYEYNGNLDSDAADTITNLCFVLKKIEPYLQDHVNLYTVPDSRLSESLALIKSVLYKT